MNCMATPQRIKFVENLSPPATGSEIRLSCLQTVAFGTGMDTRCDADNNVSNQCFVGQFCDFGADDRCNTGTSLPQDEGARLTCDPVARTCGVSCENDSDCTTAGLVGFICDTRPNSEAIAEGAMLPVGALPDALHNICVNPTCN